MKEYEKHVMKINRNYPINNLVKQYIRRKDKWRELKTVAEISGLSGCGKTTLMLDYFNDKKHFYFSFAGLEENVAENLFANKVSELTNQPIAGWEDAFTALSKKNRYIIFDDLTPVFSYKRFKNSFYENMFCDFESRPLVFLITQPDNNLTELADSYDNINVNYFSIPEIMKLFPNISKYIALSLAAVSGGIPKIFNDYNEQMTLEDNILAFLKPTSAFIEFMPYLMNQYFNKPETYNHILYAIANGNHKISEIGKFTGYAYNKCDNYISALVSAGIVMIDKEKTTHGAEKTIYVFANSYFMLWYKYIYSNRTEIAIGDDNVIRNIVKSINETCQVKSSLF